MHLALVAGAGLLVPRATARVLDAIPVELVVAEPPPRADAPAAAATPAPRMTPPKPIVKPPPKVEPRREPPKPDARRPESSVAAAPPAPLETSPTAAASPAPAAAPSVTLPATAPAPTTTPSGGAGVSLVEGAPHTPRPTGPTVASVPPDGGVTQVARPTGGYQVKPSYPTSARRLGVQGTTLLRVHVLADGRVGEVGVEESAGHPDLDQAASEAVRRWRFEPARRGSEAVAMWVRLPVEFRLK